MIFLQVLQSLLLVQEKKYSQVEKEKSEKVQQQLFKDQKYEERSVREIKENTHTEWRDKMKR